MIIGNDTRMNMNMVQYNVLYNISQMLRSKVWMYVYVQLLTMCGAVCSIEQCLNQPIETENLKKNIEKSGWGICKIKEKKKKNKGNSN